ncbi:MAG TPA: PH domain-containing protein [Thermoanaerobaculia bacterium]|nr:PH domain-containing protein [Thermoanaerobaculia bacterium]
MNVEDHLQPGEEILYRAHTSRVTLAPYYALLALALVATFIAWQTADSLPSLGVIVALIVAAVLGALVAWKSFVLRTNEYVLTNYRVIQQTGIFSKRSVDSRLDKVNNVEHRQTFWGRLLGYGDLEIDTASETGTTRFPSISRPLDFKRSILGASEQYRVARMAPSVPVFAAPPTPSAVPAAQRLRELKALYDDGLISQPEYEEKRRRLMDEL